jgi:fatty-acyl-CoA synthase
MPLQPISGAPCGDRPKVASWKETTIEILPKTRPEYVLRALRDFAEFGDRPAIVGVGWPETYTYSQVRAMILDMAATLREQGLQPGTTVAVAVAQPPEAAILQLALHLLGCRTAWTVAGTARREIDEFLQQVEPDVFIYDPRTHRSVGPELAEALGVPTFCLGPGGLGIDLRAPRPPGARPFDLDTAVGDVETIFQTSGTTGRPKRVHHREQMYEQMYAISEAWLADGGFLLRHLTLTPLSYVAGQTSAFLNLFTGGVLFVMRRFEPNLYLATIERHRVNSVYVSPLTLNAVLDCPAAETADCSSLALFSVGGAPTTAVRLRQAIKRFGRVVRVTYGLSETPWISGFPEIDDDPQRPDRIRSCGPPHGDVRVEIRDEDGGLVADGQVGELWISSRLNFHGYWNQPELTARTLVDGWVRTGDLCYRDTEGYLYLVGRVSDRIVTDSGQHLFPRPIEDALATHPDVVTAAVIGVPNSELGQAAHAFVVTTPGVTVAEDELAELVRARLADEWVPRSFDFIGDLPRTRSGKVDVKELRARHALVAGAAERAVTGVPG